MDLVKRSISKWINAAIVLTLGILIIVMGAANGDTEADEAISIILGIVLIVVGALALVLAILAGVLAKKGFAAAGVSAGVTLALGISLVAGKYAAGLIALFLYIIPYLLIVLGAVILADGIYNLVLAIKSKTSFIPMIISIVVGAVAITLGSLCVGNEPVISANAQLIVFGIVVVIYACLMVLSTFFKIPGAVIVVTKEEKAE